MIQFFARVVELREEKYVKYDGKITMDSPSREFLEVTYNFLSRRGFKYSEKGTPLHTGAAYLFRITKKRVCSFNIHPEW